MLNKLLKTLLIGLYLFLLTGCSDVNKDVQLKTAKDVEDIAEDIIKNKSESDKQLNNSEKK